MKHDQCDGNETESDRKIMQRLSSKALAFSVDNLLKKVSSNVVGNYTENFGDNFRGEIIESDQLSEKAVEMVSDRQSSAVQLSNKNLQIEEKSVSSDRKAESDTEMEDVSNISSPGVTNRYSESLTVDNITVKLCDNELWNKFHQMGNEMIITKTGRRMFPSLKISLQGLEPGSFYSLLVEMVCMDDKRYRYIYRSSQWVAAGQADPPIAKNNAYVHPDSPASGQYWLKNGSISFDKLKLTNNKHCALPGRVSLHSMHKYQPVIRVIKVVNSTANTKESIQFPHGENKHLDVTFEFKQLNFITVTAYQNQQITLLKIASNPFAKGFRENAKERTSKGCKEKEQPSKIERMIRIPANGAVGMRLNSVPEYFYYRILQPPPLPPPPSPRPSWATNLSFVGLNYLHQHPSFIRHEEI